ncbi:MAG: PfkB family carbohydrate kinase [Clostridiales bacterium]|nr:PfkB family carbohydrate kinase [Clostridiales bacterium]
MEKIISKSDISKIQTLKEQGKKIVLCHGVFDLVHPGHLIHFQEAKAMGDVLVVSVTAAKYVRKGPGRPYFDDEMRLKFLSAIECIDFVILSECDTVDDIIALIEPNLYVKGEEYKRPQDDITGKIGEEIALVRSHGGEIAYTGGQVFSSTRLINHALPALPEDVKEFMLSFKQRYSMEDIKALVEAMRTKKVLVVGDAIIDEYIYCRVQGLMSKDMGYSTRYQSMERYLGGSMAIARHLASFSENVTLMSVVGTEGEVHSRILDELSGNMRVDMIYSDVFPTIIKQRYVSLNEKREELEKIFAINNLPTPMCVDEGTLTKLKKKLKGKISQYDVVILCDFGHGLIDHELMELLQTEASFLALNCQTNSSNYGRNLITKYRRADVFTLDQKELGLAFTDYHQEESELLLKLAKRFDSHGWLTRGAGGATSVENDELRTCPAFTLKVKDTIGAGDAFFSLASLAVASGAPMEVGMFMGNIAGALAANIVGNKEAIEKVNVLKYASTLLNI